MELRFDGNTALKPSEVFTVSPMPMPSAPPPTEPEAPKQKISINAISAQDTRRAVEQANKIVELFNHDLKFETHDKTGIIQISIVDKKDGKVIKQLPPDSVLDMVAKIKDLLGGLMDVRA